MLKHGMAMVLATAICFAGCGGDKGKGTTTPDETGGGGQGGESGGGGGEDGGEGGGEGGDIGNLGGVDAGSGPSIPTEGDPEDHFLGHGDLFAGYADYTQGSLYVEPVTQISPPGSTGKGLFKNVRTGDQIETQFFWKTHKATKDEVKVGVIALVDDRKNDQGIYAAPDTIDQAYDSRWWAARIVSLKPLGPKGVVWVAGGYKVEVDAIRIMEGIDSPMLDLDGKEDAQFIQSDHWFAGFHPLTASGTIYVKVVAPVSPFEGGEGRFVNLNDGLVFDTAHAWQTKIAKKKDIKVGAQVLVADIKDGSIYRAPKTRKEALFSRWWFTKILKKEKKTVIVSGDYEVSMDNLRVVK